MENGRFIMGCTTLPSPENDESDKEWCRVNPLENLDKFEPEKTWDYC